MILRFGLMIGLLQRLMLMTAHDPLEISGFRTVASCIHTSSAEILSTLEEGREVLKC